MPHAHGVVRPRLHETLAPLWEYKLGLIVAPAGFGKTTLLAHFGSSLDGPVAWYQACPDHDSEQQLLTMLYRTLAGAVEGLSDGWRDPDDAIRALEAAHGDRTLLVIEDFHTLGSSGGEELIERLATEAPPWLAIAVSSRNPIGLNTSRLRVAGHLLEVGAEDLRFRTWEVERLFGEVYREPLAPEEIAHLARRTEGWAAGLQLFHLATRAKPPQERRRILSSLTGRSRIVREYLAQNVLEAVSDELRRFLLDTSVLGRLSPEICDTFLLRDDSAELLEELDRRQLFISELDGEGGYRYHEVFRSYLEAALLELIGETALRRRFRDAAALLERLGAHVDALRAYCRAEEWGDAARLLGRNGREVVEATHDWSGQLRPAVVGLDPWMKLALARHHRAAGRWARAMSAYREAEDSFGSEAGTKLALAERQQIASWLEAVSPPPVGWHGILRTAVSHGPAVPSREASVEPPHSALVRGICDLLSGSIVEARGWIEQAELDSSSTPLLAAGASLADAIAAWLIGDQASAAKAQWALDEFSRLNVPWLEHLAHAVVALNEGSQRLDQVSSIRHAFERIDDPWGEALTALLEALARLREGEIPIDLLNQAETLFHRLGAATFEVWALSALTLAEARGGSVEAREHAARAAALARTVGVEIPISLALLGLAQLDVHEPENLERQAGELADRGGLRLPVSPASSEGSADIAAPLEVRCFGTFELRIKGQAVRLKDLRPRVRALLRLLAVHKGRPVHREVIIESLWPQADCDTAIRNLQVAVSSLRHALEPGVTRGAFSLLVRTGEAYRLTLPRGTDMDLLRFDEGVAAGRAAVTAGDNSKAIAAFREAIELHDGELLPEDGPAEWVVKERDRYRQAALEAAEALGRLYVEEGRLSDAEWIARRGLQIDRYHDGMWRTLIEALERAGEECAAARARREYLDVLADLGV